MTKPVEKFKEFFKLWNEGQDKINEAKQVLSGGPESYYQKKIEEYVDALFTRFAPFEIGDTVILIKAPSCDNSWARSKHFLITGARGTVRGVDYHHEKFTADVMFNNESWINQDGEVVPIPDKEKHVYHLSEGFLAKIGTQSE